MPTKRDPSRNRDHQRSLRFTATELAELDEHCERIGVTFAEFSRTFLLTEVRRWKPVPAVGGV